MSLNRLNCEKIKRKLSAYIDGEINIPKKDIISNHIEKCHICKGELSVLIKQNDLLREIKNIEPSLGFRTGLWEKIKEWERLKQENEEAIKKTRLKWLLPVSAFGVIAFFVIFAFTLLIPLAYGFSSVKKHEPIYFVVNAFSSLHQKNILAPINLINYCNNCCKALCKCYQSKTNKGCICGGCENEHKN